MSGYMCDFAVSRSLALCNLALEKNNGQFSSLYHPCRAAASSGSLAPPDTEVGTDSADC